MIMTNDDDDDDDADNIDDRWQCKIFSYFSIFLTFLFLGAVKQSGHDDDDDGGDGDGDGNGDGDGDGDGEFSS